MLPPSWKSEVQKAVQETTTAERDQRKAEQNETGANITAAINSLRDAQTSQTNSEDSNEKKNQAINKATLVLVAFTVLFTGLSWWAFRNQLTEMQKVYGPIEKSANAARDAADAATKQVEITADVEKRQLRAYIGVVPPADNQIINRFIPPEKPLAHLTPRNFGLTPAYNALIHNGMGVGPYPLPKNFDYPIQGSTFLPNKITIYPGIFDIAGIIADAQRALTDQEVVAIQDGLHQRLYVWGAITYDDAFGDPHFTNFCIGFYGLTAQKIQREPCEEHNDSN